VYYIFETTVWKPSVTILKDFNSYIFVTESFQAIPEIRVLLHSPPIIVDPSIHYSCPYVSSLLFDQRKGYGNRRSILNTLVLLMPWFNRNGKTRSFKCRFPYFSLKKCVTKCQMIIQWIPLLLFFFNVCNLPVNLCLKFVSDSVHSEITPVET
jgi:hypothetical protein